MEVIVVPDDVTDKAAAAKSDLEALVGDYAERRRRIANFDRYVAGAAALATQKALKEIGADKDLTVDEAEQLRQVILAKATEYRSLLAYGKQEIKLNNGELKWHTTETWIIDVADKTLLKLIRRLRVLRLVGTRAWTISKTKLNQNPRVYLELEKRRAAHLQRTTSFTIYPAGFETNPKDNPNQLIAESVRVHEE